VAGLAELKEGMPMQHKSVGKRIILGLAAVAIGFVIWIIWGLFLPTDELVEKVLDTAVGLGVTGYLIYRWSIKKWEV
jgi:ammonia channel protein AmtB